MTQMVIVWLLLIAGSSKLSFVSDLGVLCLLTATKLWQANFTVLDIQ